MGQLWKQLLTRETITRGWHLARSDTRQDFSEDIYSTDAYGQDLKNQVQEALNRLRTNTYQARPLFRIEVPKGPLAFRPGTVIPIHDRVVLSAIVLLLAPKIEEQLPESVYSWRLKDPIPKKGPIFRETDITDLPFLKKKTIQLEVDPFEGWYRLWPKFDEASRRLFQAEGYRYLATSDIAAYFENIQLPILRDQLLQHFPKEPELVNLLCHFLEAWAERTTDGRAHFRGIPQGNFVSNFLGNLFLLPLDAYFLESTKSSDVKYFRYMDDVRIFTKTREEARVALLEMARRLRELHLNVQTAKTRIYDESRGEVSRFLIDERVDRLSDLIKNIQDDYKGEEPARKEKAAIVKKLNNIARAESPSGQKILGARGVLEGLTLRCFNRWITAHMLIYSDGYVERLLSEIAKSADQKLTRKLVATAKRFPRKRSVESSVLRMINRGEIIFPYQEAECLRAIRYLSVISEEMSNHAWSRLRDQSKERYLRMQAAYLLARTSLTQQRLRSLQQLFAKEADPFVQVAISLLLVQQRENPQEVIRKLVFHPNEKVRDIGKLLRTIKNDPHFCRKTLKHIFRSEVTWFTCDYMPLIHAMANSTKAEIRQLLLDAIREPRNNHPIGGIRDILSAVFTRTRKSLSGAAGGAAA